VILCVCPSPAIDVTYRVDRLVPGATVRVNRVDSHPGGKGVNVARVLHALGEEVLVVAPSGGEPGEELRRGLVAVGVPARLISDSTTTRRTVTVVDERGDATCLVEPSSTTAWAELVAAVEGSLGGARVVVVSGSLPGGVPPGGVAALVGAARSRGVPVVVDTHGPALLEALEAGADVVTPNVDELAAVVRDDDPTRAARQLAQLHGSVVVVSRGPDGVTVVTPAAAWEARPGAAVTGNPTGAGDALVAGLARGLARDPGVFAHPEHVLRDAVALSVAAVQAETAGSADPKHHAGAMPGVVVTALGGAG
jgi:tagatose 6-phosphate kinase